MTHTLETHQELLTLLTRMSDGGLSDTDQERLCKLLKSDASARDVYFKHVMLETSLRRESKRSQAFAEFTKDDLLAVRSMLEDEGEELEGRAAGTRHKSNTITTGSRGWRRLGTAISLLAVVAITMMLVLGRDVATITNTRDARFAIDAKRLKVGDGLGRNTSHTLDAGALEMVLTNGVEVVVNAPAEWRFESADRMVLTRGEISATVPPQAIGFTVATPSVDVVDLGTVFGVAVQPDGEAEIQVFEGEVEAHVDGVESTSDTLRLTENQAAQVSEDHQLLAVGSIEEVGIVDLYPQALTGDSVILAQYRFDRAGGSSRDALRPTHAHDSIKANPIVVGSGCDLWFDANSGAPAPSMLIQHTDAGSLSEARANKDYFEFTLTPRQGKQAVVTSVRYDHRSFSGELRWSVLTSNQDHFKAPIDQPTLAFGLWKEDIRDQGTVAYEPSPQGENEFARQVTKLDHAGSQPITYRIYIHGALGNQDGGRGIWFDNITIRGHLLDSTN